MSSNSLKSWQTPWSTEEIVKNASNWSLAGDAGLLKHLESFSENLLTKAEETQNNLNELLSGLNNASLALDEAKNDFRTLRNTQFIESRVYEDDETVQEANKSQEEEVKRQSEEEKMKDVKDAILAGIKVVEKYFDKVEVSASDSEDEGDFTSFVLKPKDPYIDRPLPFIIGTDDWHKKWHVGLLDSSSESEADKVSEKFSDSDTESDLSYDGDKMDEISDTFLNTNRTNVNQPVANSTFDESSKPPDLFGDSDTDNNEPSLNYVTSQNKNFANELASKLDKYAGENEINKKPINTSSSGRQYGYLFSDEPPPIDDVNDNNNGKGLFSGGGGLFDDTDNAVNLWNEDVSKKTEKSKVSNLFDEDDDLFNDTISYGNISQSKDQRPVESISRGLFDDEDDDLFNDNITHDIPSKPTPYLSSITKPTIPFLADEPPELEPSVVTPKNSESKKPFGGVKLMEKSDLFENKKIGSFLKPNKQDSFENSDDEKSLDNPEPNKLLDNSTNINKPESEKKPKQLSLFDDDEEDENALFENDLFSNLSSKNVFDTITKEIPDSKPEKEVSSSDEIPKPSSLFDDFEETEDLFSSIIKTEKESVRVAPPEVDIAKDIPPLSSVYDSNPPDIDDWDTKSDNIFDDGGLFDNIPEMSSQRSGLFDNEPPSLFFDSSGIVKDFSTRLGTTDDSFSPYASSTRRFSTDIFNEEQSNDSFFVTKNKSQFEHQHVQSSLGIIPEVSFSNSCDSNQSIIEITPSGDVDNLFSDTTNSVFADNLEVKKDQDESESNQTQMQTESNPMKEVDDVKEAEPMSPKLDSPGKLKHNLKINVGALIPGASPPKKRIIKSEATKIEDDLPSLDPEPEETLKTPPKEVSFGDAEVLPSITKDRVRIPVKRRPSTRKARQESLRNSVPDFKIISIISDSEEVNQVDCKGDVPKSDRLDEGLFDDFENNSSVFIDSPLETTVDRLSIAKKVTSVEEVQSNDVNITKRPHINSDSFESEDYKQLNLFDENEEFDDIFSSKKLPPKSNILKESLFDDDLDDDDDIFGSSSSTFKKESLQIKGSTKSSEKKVTKTNQIKKLENSEAVEDPLSLFLDN